MSASRSAAGKAALKRKAMEMNASTRSAAVAATKAKPAPAKPKKKRDSEEDDDDVYDEADDVDPSDTESDNGSDSDFASKKRDSRVAAVDSEQSDTEEHHSKEKAVHDNPAELSRLPESRDFSYLQLKPDADRRPIWVCPNGRVFLDTQSPIYKQAYDFLIAISDPVCRPQFVHEYQITSYSLYAAASLGLQTSDILSGLHRLSKVALAPQLMDFIKEKTEKCGKVKLLLKKTRYFVESIYPEVLKELLKEAEIMDARIDDKRIHRPAITDSSQSTDATAPSADPNVPMTAEQEAAAARHKFGARVVAETIDDGRDVRDEATGFLLSNTVEGEEVTLPGTNNAKADQRKAMGLAEFDAVVNDDAPTNAQILAIEIDANKVEQVRRRCNDISYPMLEEYDFRRDSSTPDLPIHLKPSAQIREYQEKSLSKMFGNGRARSGIIVLPCGAGKTLVGITAAATVKKSTLVFCTTGVAVDQWRRQFLHWSTVPAKNVCQFTSSVKDKVTTESLVLITTYNMVSFAGKRSAAADEIMSHITTQEWGLVVLDEVHVAPAKMFRKAVSITHSRAKLGLTATLVREDNLVDDLYYLIGPKLYEANWLDLQTAGYIATVQCVEVWCDMTPSFYSAYLTSNIHKQMLLYVMNPNKFRACEYLIRLHEARGDKVLVFSDNVFALRYYAQTLGKPLIYGATSDHERLEFLHHFQHDPNINTLFISKVGDNSIDLPDVNVIIQISSHFSSRRQEAQRLGRILRPKSASLGRFNAYFYTLVSKDTREMVYATKRQRFLVDQGYAFKVVTRLTEMDSMSDLRMGTEREQNEMLARVMAVDEAEGEIEAVVDDPYENVGKQVSKQINVERKRGNALALSGADDRAYAEFERRQATKKKAPPNPAFRSGLFKQRAKEQHEERKR